MADAPAWRVRGTKKGDWPIDVEKRKHHTVTCIRNVSGDANVLCTELQDALGAGGTVRGSVVELQGAHTDRCVAFLAAQGYIGPISRVGLFQWCASAQHGQFPANDRSWS